VVKLLPYQAKWVNDNSRLKIVVKGRQTGFSWAATLRAVLACLDHKVTWIFLSKGERQSRLLMEKVADHIKAVGLLAELHETNFMEGTVVKQLEARFPNGSVIYGLPANPDTARGYSGNVTLDEFAFHQDAERIYAALYPSITRGYSIEVISTPNGKQGKYYDLAKKAGLVAGETPDPDSSWSPHVVDIYQAAVQGLAESAAVGDGPLATKLTDSIAAAFQERGVKPSLRMVRFVSELRAGADYDDDWMQEYCCQFVSTAENFITPELVKACLSAEASMDLPQALLVKEVGEFFLGIDIGRKHDRTVFWLDRINLGAPVTPGAPPRRVATTRRVETQHGIPFQYQVEHARVLLKLKGATGSPLIRRCCIDATGMGAPLAEALATEFGSRVEPTVFTSLVKEDLAFRTKRFMENGQTLFPDAPEVRQAFGAIRKVTLPSGAIRFDAERTEAGHADHFWAKALADLAGDKSIEAASAGLDDVEEQPRRWSVWDPSQAPEEAEEALVGAEATARPGLLGPHMFLRRLGG
jgi:phage FluMu gp28-like protein